MRPGEPEVLEKCLKNNKKTRNQDIIENSNKGNRTKGRSLKILKKRANFGEHYDRKRKRWNGID